MAKKGRPGRRSLRRRIEAMSSVEARLRGEHAAEIAKIKRAVQTREIQQAADMAGAILREREKVASINDAIKAFRISVVEDGAAKSRLRYAERFALQVSIWPEMYVRDFLNARGGDAFRNYSAFAHYTAQDLAAKIERVLVEQFEKVTGGMPVY
jgi:hypothetical protein